LRGTDGTAIGAIYDYATHATSLGSGQYVNQRRCDGPFCSIRGENTGKEVVTPVFAGASGNIDPWFRVLPGFNNEPGWIPEPVLLGTLLGEEVGNCIPEDKRVKSRR